MDSLLLVSTDQLHEYSDLIRVLFVRVLAPQTTSTPPLLRLQLWLITDKALRTNVSKSTQTLEIWKNRASRLREWSMAMYKKIWVKCSRSSRENESDDTPNPSLQVRTKPGSPLTTTNFARQRLTLKTRSLWITVWHATAQQRTLSHKGGAMWHSYVKLLYFSSMIGNFSLFSKLLKETHLVWIFSVFNATYTHCVHTTPRLLLLLPFLNGAEIPFF